MGALADLSMKSLNTIETSAAYQAALEEFENTLNSCVDSWRDGNEFVALPGNIQERYGDVLLGYFQRVLIDQVGGPVTFTTGIDKDGQKTFVQMPKSTSLALDLANPKGPSQPDIDDSNGLTSNAKKPPRPMNCWIIFRDTMYKKLKAENPNLSVQHISTRCSQIWRNLTPNDVDSGIWLHSRPTKEIARLIRSIREPEIHAAITSVLLSTPTTASSQSTAPVKTKKALNAFVGFRCYYITIPAFNNFSMKRLSSIMGQLWEADSNKSIWSLLAKAWSVIRDQIGKTNAPLDVFFHIVCPHLGLPPPETYFESHGWKLAINNEGAQVLTRDINVQTTAPVAAGHPSITLSIEDIINYCQAMGYAQAYKTDHDTASPTFLGRTTASVQELRTAERNKRRAKRENVGNSKTALALMADISRAHGKEYPLGLAEDSTSVDNERSPLYKEVVESFSNPLEPTLVSATGFGMEDPDFSLKTNGHPFRNGADEDATLPSFPFIDV